jgi:hypothetical protein
VTKSRRDPKSLKKKIASLSALGAGALVLGAGKADAATVTSGNINFHVGFDIGGQDHYQSPGFGSHNATFSFQRFQFPQGSGTSRYIWAYGCGCLSLASQIGRLQLFDAGERWTPDLYPNTSLMIGGRSFYLRAVTHSHTRPDCERQHDHLYDPIRPNYLPCRMGAVLRQVRPV